METQSEIKKMRRLVWWGSIIVLAAIAVAVAASWTLYEHTVNLLTQNLRERLLSISITQAANLDAETLAMLQTEEDWQKPEWRDVVTHLKRTKDANKDIVFMYIFRKTAEDPSQMEFVADAESLDPYANLDDNPDNDVDANGDGLVEADGADKLQWPGQPYPEAVDIPEAYAAYDGAITVAELYEDAYGQVLTGYAPIKDSQGNTVAILATDIKAGDFFALTRQTLVPFVSFIAFLTAVIAILAAVLIFIWQKRAEAFGQLDRLKDEFVSIASHQLRAPMASIRGYAANMADGTYGAVPEHLKEPLANVQEISRLMVKSIEDYLNVSRIEQGRMKYEKARFNIADTARKVVNELTPVASKKGLTLSVNAPEDIQINGDIGKLNQVFVNLIDNAVKYTEHGSVHVSVDKTDKAARITIQDTGVGIDPKELPDLFEKFTRARGANKINTTGTGLGLYVAKQLVEGHGGLLRAESDGPGKGTRFIVELPLA